MNEYFFEKNSAIFTAEEQETLRRKRVIVIGCGGLGGSVIEILARTGIGHLTLVDPDVFSPSNMNRQLGCTAETIGKPKAETMAKRVVSINPQADVRVCCENLREENATALIRSHDIVIDALDSVSARLLLEDACAAENILLIHGAVGGWSLQTAVCPPGSGILHKLYRENEEPKDSPGGIAMTVFSCASFEVSEAVKALLGRPDTLLGKVLFFDLLEKTSMIVPF